MSNALLKIIKLGIGLILFIPLYINGSFFFPFIFPKILVFQIITEIIFLAYIILCLTDFRFHPRYNIAATALVLLTLILVITSFTGIDTFRSFWGNAERMSGVITWLHFAVFAFILSGVLRSKKDWRMFFGITVLVSIFEFFYVLAQYFNLPIVWMPGNLFGTIGNTDLLGTYAIFNAFFALYLWREDDGGKKWRSGWWLAAFAANLGTLFIASSRGAILGFGAGILVYLFYILKDKKINFKILGFSILILAAVYLMMFLGRNSDFIKNNRQLNRITNVSLNDDTVQQRFTEWGIAWSAFKSRPIFGFGPNNYLYLHNLFLDPRVYELRETNFDRAHNAYLDYASMSGILGLLGYLSLIGIMAFSFWKRKIQTFAALMAAYAVQSFFVFDSPASYILLFMVLGAAMSLDGNSQNHEDISFSPQVATAIVIAATVFTAYVFWQASLKQAAANYNFTRAFNGIEAKILSPDDDFEVYKKSLKYETLGATEFRNQYIYWLQKNLSYFEAEKKLEVIDFGIGELEKEVAKHPSVFSFLNLGQLYGYKARGYGDESIKRHLFEKAAKVYDRALEISPGRLEVYYAYLQNSLDTKDYDKGIEVMKRAVSSAPKYWQTHWYLGIAYTAAEKNEDAVKTLNDALSLFYGPEYVKIVNNRLAYDYETMIARAGTFTNKAEILGVVNPYLNLKMWPELLLLYLSAERDNPDDIGIHQSLALVYQNLGLTDRASEELKIVDNLKKK